MSNLGIGVMLGILGGNSETVAAVTTSLNKVIETIVLTEEELSITLADGTKLILWDDGQSCCESRYMRSDDDLFSFEGDTLLNIQLKDGGATEGKHGDTHEIQFLDITTSKGMFQIASHNEHNGYYGGFYIKARLTTKY